MDKSRPNSIKKLFAAQIKRKNEVEQAEMPTTSSENTIDEAAVHEEGDTNDETDNSDCEDEIVDSTSIKNAFMLNESYFSINLIIDLSLPGDECVDMQWNSTAGELRMSLNVPAAISTQSNKELLISWKKKTDEHT